MVVATMFVAVAAATLLTDLLPIPREALYILTGIALGGVATFPDLTLVAEAGGVLLIFLTVTHLQTAAVRDVLPTALWTVAAQALLLAAIAGAALLAGFALYDAFLLALAGSLSSSMLGFELIENQVDRHLLQGRLSEAITFSQDILAVLLITTLPFLARPTTALMAGTGAAILLLAGMSGRRGMRRVFHWMDRDEATTLMLGLPLLWTVIAFTAGHRYGVITGAVAAGILLSAHPENLTLLETMEPVKAFFTALFFVTLGILATPLTLNGLGLALLLILLITLLRPALTILVLRWRGTPIHTAYTTALQLNQASEVVLLFSLLLLASRTVTSMVFEAVVVAAAGSYLISAITTRNAQHLYPRLHAYIGKDHARLDRTGHTIVAGYGGWGRAAAETLTDPVIIDNDPQKVERAEQDGYAALLGDVRDYTTWTRANTAEAALVVLTTPDDDVAATLNRHDGAHTLIAITETPEAAATLTENGAAYATDDTALARTALHTALEDAITRILDDAQDTR